MSNAKQEGDRPPLSRGKRIAFATVVVLLSTLVGVAGYRLVDRILFVQKGDSTWPTRQHPQLGVTFLPGRRVVWAGKPGSRREFRAEHTANSWGFLDVEHDLEKPSGVTRVLLLGDSFVEAAQVDISEKVGRLLEQRLSREDRPVEVISLGYSGMGTSNLWVFYDKLGRDFRPDLVVLLLVNNDLKDNSPELDSRELGGDPAHSREFYFDLDAAGDVVELPPAEDWREHRREWTGRWDRTGAWLSESSKHWPAFVPFLEAHPGYLEATPEPEDPTRYLGVTNSFAFFAPEAEWPPVMVKARILSDASIERFATDTRGLGARLAMVWVSSLVELTDDEEIEVDGRRLVPATQRTVWSRIAERHGVPYLDLVDAFQKRPDPASAHFPVDGHWTATGHRWAAETIADLVDERALLQ